MKAIFLDTSFLIAVIRAKDQYHAAALKWKAELQGQFVTTEYVLIELLDASAPRSLRRRGLNAIRILRSAPTVEVVGASAQYLEEGLGLFEQHADKDWGLTDCISFAVMRQKGITEALTADRHYEQAGFRALLRAVAS